MKTLDVFLFSLIRATCHVYYILLVLTVVIIFGEEYKLWSSSFCSFLETFDYKHGIRMYIINNLIAILGTCERCVLVYGCKSQQWRYGAVVWGEILAPKLRFGISPPSPLPSEGFVSTRILRKGKGLGYFSHVTCFFGVWVTGESLTWGKALHLFTYYADTLYNIYSSLYTL
jgi:hypothetical protein